MRTPVQYETVHYVITCSQQMEETLLSLPERVLGVTPLVCQSVYLPYEFIEDILSCICQFLNFSNQTIIKGDMTKKLKQGHFCF